MATKRLKRHVRSRGTTTGGPGRARHTVLDEYLPHADLVIRHQVAVPAKPEDAWNRLRGFDWAQLCEPVGRAIEDMRAVPPFILELTHRARHLPSTTRFLVEDALRKGFVLLADKPNRHLVLGAVGKMWKSHFDLVTMDREDFASFHDPKYVKIITGFLVSPRGDDRSLLKHESRIVATDDSARAHLGRSWRVAEPYVDFFKRHALATLSGSAREERAQATVPPWRPRAKALR